VPLVTVGHNIQYHCIIYSMRRTSIRLERRRNFAGCGIVQELLGLCVGGLAFTLVLYRDRVD
jgi:hypothetical protein